MISYTGRATYIDLDHDQAVVEIRSALCLYRVVVRGTFVHIAMDSDREAAPAEVQANERLPETSQA